MTEKFSKEEIQEFIKEVFKVIDNNNNESKKTKTDLIKKEVERRVKR